MPLLDSFHRGPLKADAGLFRAMRRQNHPKRRPLLSGALFARPLSGSRQRETAVDFFERGRESDRVKRHGPFSLQVPGATARRLALG